MKSLYRRPCLEQVAGVCEGMGEYCDIDPVEIYFWDQYDLY